MAYLLLITFDNFKKIAMYNNKSRKIMIKIIKPFLKTIIVGLVLAPFTLQAGLVPIDNFSFEAMTVGSNTSANSVTGWTHDGVAGSDPGSFGFTNSAEGSRHLYLQLPGFGGESPTAITTNAGSIGVANAGTYTLTVAGGRRNNNATTTGSYIIELFSGSVLLAANTVLNPRDTWASGSWNDMTASIFLGLNDLNLGGDLSVRLSATGDLQAQFDNVRLDFVEASAPSVFALLGLGFTVLLVSRRK